MNEDNYATTSYTISIPADQSGYSLSGTDSSASTITIGTGSSGTVTIDHSGWSTSLTTIGPDGESPEHLKKIDALLDGEIEYGGVFPKKPGVYRIVEEPIDTAPNFLYYEPADVYLVIDDNGQSKLYRGLSDEILSSLELNKKLRLLK